MTRYVSMYIDVDRPCYVAVHDTLDAAIAPRSMTARQPVVGWPGRPGRVELEEEADVMIRTEERMTYKIIRHYKDHWPNKRTVRRGLTLEEAQEHCRDPETSSSKATSAAARRRTALFGPWFDGYEEEKRR